MTDSEIIEALATKVMGWVRESGAVPHDEESPCDCDWYEQPYDGSGPPVEYFTWNPLADPAASKQVREKLAERYADWSLTFDRDWPQAPFEFGVWNNSNQESPKFDVVLGRGMTEERAVALAALKTVGVNV